MIQDIGSKKFLNQYENVSACEDDYVFAFSEGKVLISGEPGGELDVPKANNFDRERLQYLFCIDERRYFLYMDFDFSCEDWNLEGFRWENPRLLRQKVSKDICFASATAMHLYVWYRDNSFCGRCAKPLLHKESERALVCSECGNTVYPQIAPAVIVALVDGDRILMTKYAGRTFKRYALIAGFTEIGETAEETVKREVMEEVGLKVKSVRYYKSQPWGVDSDLLLGFVAELDGSDSVTLDEDELSTAEWFTRENMPVTENDDISLTREMMWAFREGIL